MLMNIASAVECPINEGMQTKPDYVPLLISELGGCFKDLDQAFKNHETDIKDYKGPDVHDDKNLMELSCDKHEESIVWRGGLKAEDTQFPYSTKGEWGGQVWQPEETGLAGTHQLIDWWAATWCGTMGSKEAGDEFKSTLSSVHTDSSAQEEDTLSWSDTERPKPVRGSNTDIYNSYADSSQSMTLEDARTSLQHRYISPITFSTGYHSNAVENSCHVGLPRSQETSQVFALKALHLEEDKMSSTCRNVRHQSIEDMVSDNKVNKSAFKHDFNEKSVLHNSVAMESVSESCRYTANMEDLDKLVQDTKWCKENIKKDIDSLTLLRQKAEQEEIAAQHAKLEAASRGVEIFKKVEELRQQISCKKADYEMRAADVYGEKSILSIEARELKARLVETQADHSKALSLVEDIRSTLLARLESASGAKEAAMEETTMKMELANELLAAEQVAAQKLEQDLRTLEAEVERCKQLRKFLVERGNMVDSLQGELAVLCEDVITFKRQVDEGIPLSGSCSLSWSRLSHMTAASSPPTSTSPKSMLLESSPSSTSLVNLASVTSEPSKNIRPIECALHPQYFSPGSMVEMCCKQCPDNMKRSGTQDSQRHSSLMLV